MTGKPNAPAVDCCSDERTGAPLIPVDRAVEIGVALARMVPETDLVDLDDVYGRILADDLVAPMPLPPFDNSGMDGYALRHGDVAQTGSTQLKVTGRVAAGDDAGRAGVVGQNEAFRIFTGAALPQGADAIIMQEHVERAGDTITLTAPVADGNNVRRKGEDAPEGSLLLSAGTHLGAREIAAIASIGQASVRVRRKVRIALFCTGSELRQPGQSLAPGQIYNSNRYMMMAALRMPSVSLRDFGAVEDDPDKLRLALIEASEDADIIITTGGVSVGEEDHMVEQLVAAGGQIDVMKIAMKPGKPLSVGTLNSAIFIGLPGNPVAAYTTWKVIGQRIADKVSGLKASPKAVFQVELGGDVMRRAGRQEYRPARIIGTSPSGHPVVELLDHSFSAKISLICSSDGFAVIPPEATELTSGMKLSFVAL